jgi:hypothetical protein
MTKGTVNISRWLLMRIGTVVCVGSLSGFTAYSTCPDMAAATTRLTKCCPCSEGTAGCKMVIYKDIAGYEMATVCGAFIGHRCCPNGVGGPATKTVYYYPCNLFGDDCSTSWLFTEESDVSGVTLFKSYTCAEYSSCPPMP